jgi:hypothetical protein
VNSLYKFFSNGTRVLISKKFSIESSINQILTKIDEIVREIGLNYEHKDGLLGWDFNCNLTL